MTVSIGPSDSGSDAPATRRQARACGSRLRLSQVRGLPGSQAGSQANRHQATPEDTRSRKVQLMGLQRRPAALGA
jgi:hypothetical protein